MTIKKKSSSHTNDDKAAKFIDAAAVTSATSVLDIKAVKKPVALRFDDGLLARIDAAARRKGISRNAWISFHCAEALENE